ncbi:unnamed protein product [Symbiodinium sp. CCMP2592]|nr:unnamed protein product [Symbiodinium sp. CCMP2592]
MGAECSNPTCGRGPEMGRCPESSVQAQSCHAPLPPDWSSGDCAESRCGEYEFDTSLFFDDHISPPDELVHPAFATMQGNWYRKEPRPVGLGIEPKFVALQYALSLTVIVRCVCVREIRCRV